MPSWSIMDLLILKNIKRKISIMLEIFETNGNIINAIRIEFS
jgi:hypothetical protein